MLVLVEKLYREEDRDKKSGSALLKMILSGRKAEGFMVWGSDCSVVLWPAHSLIMYHHKQLIN
jgi:hypothetical protein